MSTPTTAEHQLPADVTVALAPAEAAAALQASARERRRNRQASVRRMGVQLLSVAIFLALWWLVTALKIWPEITVPRPSSVWDAFINSLSVNNKTELNPEGVRGYSDHYLYEHLWASLWRIIQGVAWGVAFGVPLGLMMSVSRWFRVIVEPYVNFIRSLPPLAYFSLFLIWFGLEDTSKVVLLFVASFAPVAMATYSGVQGVRGEYVHAARSLGASRLQVIRHTILPGALPEVITGIRVSAGFAWTTIVAAETANGIPGIGGLAWQTKKFNQTDVAILCIIVIGIAAIAIDSLLKTTERSLVPWRGKA